MEGAFYIHGGPANETDLGFGSAGCVEIIGNYDVFKQQIAELSGLTTTTSVDASITKLVRERNLLVIVATAKVPDIRASYTREL